MTPPVSREIRSRQSVHQLPDLLQSLFAAELLAPSQEIWLVSPWVSDVVLLDNSAGQFAVLSPEWPRGAIRLSQVFLHLVERGSVVHLATRDTDWNRAVHDRLADASRSFPGRLFLHLDLQNRLHEKGLLTDHFYLEGSFNFTHNGITLNEERAVLHLAPEEIAENRVALRRRWPEGSR